MNEILLFSVLSKLNSGSSLLDAFLILSITFIPQLFRKLGSRNLCFWSPRDVIKTIVSTRRIGIYGWIEDSDEDDNEDFIRSILYFMNVHLVVKFRTSDLTMYKLPHAEGVCDTPDIFSVPSGTYWTRACDMCGCHIDILREVVETSTDSASRPVTTICEKYFVRARRFARDGCEEKAISFFLHCAKSAYDAYMSKRFDKGARYYFTMVKTKIKRIDREDGEYHPEINDDRLSFRKYRLSSTKTFDNVYHPSIPYIRQTLQELSTKTGKFAVDGRSRKANILLHGPPGTGKTSMIKAISNFCNRHIVCVNLANIETSQELMDIMFAEYISVTTYSPKSKITVANSEVIFVMEDIDAACEIVRDRETKKANLLSESKDNTQQVSKDPLTLATLLNVLDGPLDCDNRIIVLTTNFVDHLDSALVRPGRITMKIEMSFMKGDEAIRLIELYFPGELTDEYKIKISKHLQENDITPSEIELYCTASSTIIDVIAYFGK